MSHTEADLTTFQARYRKHYRSVFYFFFNRGLPEEECKDLTQDTFLRVYKNMNSFRGEADFYTWLLKVSTNIWCNYLRAKSTFKRDAKLVPLEKIAETAEKPHGSPGAAKEEDPLAQLIQDEQEELVYQAIETLPPNMRRVMLLRLKPDLKYREIADIMNLSIDTVKSHLHKARQKIKDHLSKHHHDVRN